MSPEPVAAELVAAALTEVFTSQAVSVLRDDSPLAAVGCTDADMVCIADAIAEAALSSGAACVLDDGDVAEVVTVADLKAAVRARLDGEVPA